MRLIQDHNLSYDVDSLGIKGTGVRGMLTKGDVLAHLGLAQGPNGTFKPMKQTHPASESKPALKEEVEKDFTGDEVRRAILAGLERRIRPKPITLDATFDSILADCTRRPSSALPRLPTPAPIKVPAQQYFQGLI